jgi:hypothetical protein
MQCYSKTEYKSQNNKLIDDLYGKAEKDEKKAGITGPKTWHLKKLLNTATKSKIKLAETAAIKAANIFKGDPNDKTKKNNTAYQTLNDLYDKADSLGVKLPRIIAPIDGGGFGLVNPEVTPDAAVETAATPTAATPRVLTEAESKALATGRRLPPPTVEDTPPPADPQTPRLL